MSVRERGEADRISRSDNQHAAAVGSVVKNNCGEEQVSNNEKNLAAAARSVVKIGKRGIEWM